MSTLIYKKERTFKYPCDKVAKILMDTEESSYDMSELENVTKWKSIKEINEPDRRIGTKEWCAHGQIPKALQHILSPRMLTWLEHSEWNRKTNTYSFRIETFYMKNIVSCSGRTIFKASGTDKCIRDFYIDLKVNIPVLGPLVEGLVIDFLKKNEEQDFNLSARALEKALGKKP